MREIGEKLLRFLGLRRWTSPTTAFALATGEVVGVARESAKRPNAPSGSSAGTVPPNDDAKAHADKLAAEIAELYGTLPIEIRDPVSRGRPDPVIWSSIPERPSVHDLMRLSASDFENYRTIVRLTEQWQALQHTADRP